MKDDLLGEATRALRDEATDDTPPGLPNAQVTSLTRARIMASLHERRRKRTTRAVMALPLVAVFVAGTAWAAQSGALPSILQGLLGGSDRDAPADTTPAPPAAPPPPRPSSLATSVEPPVTDGASGVDRVGPSASAPTGVALPSASPEPVTVAVPSPKQAGTAGLAERVPPSSSAPSPQVATSPSASAAAHASPAPSASSAPTEARRLYERAHRAHFEEKNPAAALAAWDAYLAALSTASRVDAAFATEAAYNRAICLVRLGRVGPARAALTPFAEGLHGGYRKDEARALLDALGPKDSPP